MTVHLMTLLQSLVPQHSVSKAMGWLTHCQTPWLKNYLIRTFIRHYNVDLRQAEHEGIDFYKNFNAFFTRRLQPQTRPICAGEHDIACPVDGYISQFGDVDAGTLIQVKNHTYQVANLLGMHQDEADHFLHGQYATFYLAPHNYHRVHMPFDGQLKQMRYCPGKLYSVNAQTLHDQSELLANNERIVCLFDTAFGQCALVLVGAIMVGSLETVWAGTITPPYGNTLRTTHYASPIALRRGEEMGRFNMGSTVIVVLEKHARITWQPTLQTDQSVNMGTRIGTLLNSSS